MIPNEFAGDISDALACLAALHEADPIKLRDCDALIDYLYEHWFHDYLPPLLWPSTGSYAAATTLPELFSPGWSLKLMAPEGIRVQHSDGMEAVILPGDFAPFDATLPLSTGLVVRRLMRNAAPIPGFWHLWSDRWRMEGPPARMVRIYFPLPRSSCLQAAQILLSVAPSSDLWAAKFLSGYHSGGRRDPALLYLPTGEESAAWVIALIECLSPLLTGAKVRLAHRWNDGACLAPDPGKERSFGQACCTAIAESVLAVGGVIDRELIEPELSRRLAVFISR
jgi:hypothetical protein